MSDLFLRKIPRQKRSKDRVDHILTVAEQLFATQGYEATTTNHVADHAQVSVGSLYQFFPNKEALRDALIERYLADMIAFKASDQMVDLSVSVAIRLMVEGTLQFSDAHAGFINMFLSQYAPMQMQTLIVANIAHLLTARFALDPAMIHQTAEFSVAIVKGTLHLSALQGTYVIDDLIAETVFILTHYLRGVLLRAGLDVPPDIA